MEYLDIVDENNEFTGIVEERKKAHDPNYNFTAWKDEQFQSEMELLKSKRSEILKECGENYEKFNK